jgi:hypothetical protein
VANVEAMHKNMRRANLDELRRRHEALEAEREIARHAAPGRVYVGAWVRLHGLTTERGKQMNGRIGRVAAATGAKGLCIAHADSEGRVCVCLDSLASSVTSAARLCGRTKGAPRGRKTRSLR